MQKTKIKSILNDIENPTILEIGANDGSDSEDFALTFSELKLHCFEPDPRAIASFCLRMSYFLSIGSVLLHEFAISNVDGETTFWMSDSDSSCVVGANWNKSGSIKKPTNHLVYHPWCKFDNQIKVKTMRLDTWAKDLSLIDFIWADVQGAEQDLIEGAGETLLKTKYFYTEFSDVPMYGSNSSKDFITSLLPEFNLIDVVDNNLLFKNKHV